MVIPVKQVCGYVKDCFYSPLLFSCLLCCNQNMHIMVMKYVQIITTLRSISSPACVHCRCAY